MAKSPKVDEVAVDFSETESRGGKKSRGSRPHYPEGDYAARVKKTSFVKSSEKKTPGILVEMVLTHPKKYKGKAINDTLWLSEGAAWRIRQFMEACGLKVPSKKVKVNPSKWHGKELAITLEDEEHKERVYSNVIDFYLVSELDMTDSSDDEDDDDEDDEDDEDEDDDEEDEDLEGVDLDDI